MMSDINLLKNKGSLDISVIFSFQGKF